MQLDWHYLHGEPTQEAWLKAKADDFKVTEDLGFTPCGEGEHLLVHIRKTGENTPWVAGLLAEAAGLPRASVSWAGLKDRHAVTEQWFSLHLPGKPDPDLSAVVSERIQILGRMRHNKKLRPGTLRGNRFLIRLTGLEASSALDQRLSRIGEQGVPNYFGEQRFGRGGNNLSAAQSMFAGRRIKERDKRAIYLSAARSYLFNQVVSARVAQGLAQQLLPGDCLMAADSSSLFWEPAATPELSHRLAAGELRLTAPLWGRGRPLAQGAAAEWEQAVLAPFGDWMPGLEAAGLSQERRPLLLKPREFCWQWQPDALLLSFWLPAGCYATSLIRELVRAKQADPYENTGK